MPHKNQRTQDASATPWRHHLDAAKRKRRLEAAATGGGIILMPQKKATAGSRRHGGMAKQCRLNKSALGKRDNARSK
ncbi:hypothetical protein [Thiorhodospira sibirica]|uniref:hypothetical protein n=1 Tax=Thiorhodospira sibirica TaxID=154347 RepID=UPI001112C1E3|nr:hypothetical protein [Thiorhodospira sibirica]